MSCKYLCVSGYGWSGSGLYIDFLKELDGFSSLDFEFSLIKEPKGLLDLDYALTENWDVLRAHFALNDFKEYCNILNRKDIKIGRWGLDIGASLAVDFIKVTDEFVVDISKFKYQGNTRIQKYHISHIQSLFQKIARRVMPKRFGSQQMIFAQLGNKEFARKVRRYLNKLFDERFKSDQVKCLILDQAIPTTNSLRALEYLESSKLIIIDRDPRDIYVDLIRNNVLMGADAAGVERAQKYVTWHRGLRAGKPAPSRDILHLNFEDLIITPSVILEKLKIFIDLEGDWGEGHNYDFSQSAGNVGLWKQFPFNDEIKFIEENLMECG